MLEIPHAELLQSELTGDLIDDLETFREILNLPDNKDVVFRRFTALDFDACLIFVEGMADNGVIGRLILQSALFSQEEGMQVDPEARADFLRQRVVSISQAENKRKFGELTWQLLDGATILLADGCREAVCLETRGFDRRAVGRTQNESVVVGAQEGFVESLRTNTTLMHRYLQSPQLITEYIDVGLQVPTHVAIMYLKGVAEEARVAEMKARLGSIHSSAVLGIGQVQQLIEDHPHALLPQMMQTERPDRAAACLLDGQIAVFANNSPYALIAPVTVYHMLHASDDSFLRWQYGSFLRIIRLIGILFSLFLPASYIALTLFHAHLIPVSLLTSIARTRAEVPFSIVVEVFLMEASFYLINEAGTRIPSQIGSALGIVGALILGQAAVAASIISPILIIIIALTGLGNYAIPNYTFSLGILLYRLCLEVAAALFGFYGIVLVSFAAFCRLCGMKSLGVPYFAPVAPYRPHNPDIILRLPLKKQSRPIFFARRDSWLNQ